MDLELTKEQKILKSSVRDFLKKECPPSLMREMRDDQKGYVDTVWKKMANLGWLGVVIPEAYGGMGGDFMDLSILMECMGEVCCPGPFFSSVVLGGLAILDGGLDAQKEALLPKLANGDLILALGLTEPGNWYEVSANNTKATAEKDGFVINGKKLFVENAHIADYILCATRTDHQGKPDDGITLFLVDAKGKGVQCTVLDTLGYEKQCEVVLKDVRVPVDNIIGKQGKAFTLLENLREKAAVAKCAEMVGCIQKAFDMTVAYVKERKQFGRPVGSFQAVQHHCANMVIDVDGARFITYQAAWKISQGLSAGLEASMAKAWTSGAARRVTFLGHQLHGAISFCDEHDMHLYYRKAKAAEVAFGDSDYHLEKVAQHLGL